MHGVLSFIVLGLAAGAQAQAFPTEEVDAYVLEQMEQQELAGVAIAVNAGGRLAYSQGYGLADLQAKRLMTPKTKFEIGSMADLFLAMASLRLVEQQKLSLDAPVHDLLGTAVPAAWSGVKLRHVLGHTSGLPDVLESDRVDPFGNGPAADLLKAAGLMALKGEPGSAWDYSSTNPMLAAQVLGKIGEKPWAEQADALFWKPTGMASTGLARDNDLLLSTGYSSSDDGWIKTEASSLALRQGLGGGVASTVEDWARFDLAYGKETLMSKASWALLKGPEPVKKGGNTHGFAMETGKFDDGTPWVGCMGFGDGFSGHYVRLEGLKMSVIVFCNTEGADALQIAQGIVEIIQAATTDGG